MTVLLAEVVNIDTRVKSVRLADGQSLSFDYLILAMGSAYSFFGHDDWAPYALLLKSLPDALAIRSRLLGAFEQAEQSCDHQNVKRFMTIVIVGGGPTGVELAGTIAELARSTLACDFKHIDPKSARIVLCEMGPRLLSSFSETLSSYAAQALGSLGVEVHLGTSVTLIDANGLTLGNPLEGGLRIEAATILWCAGTKARPGAAWLDAKASKTGGIIVQPDCTVPGHPKIYAIGDQATFYNRKGKPLPGLAPVAKQQGHYVGSRIKAELKGKTKTAPFRYRDMGSMAVIGRSRAVAHLLGLNLTGFIAWLTWSFVHLMLLTNFRNRIIVYINWAWAWFTYARGARLITNSDLKQTSAETDTKAEALPSKARRLSA